MPTFIDGQDPLDATQGRSVRAPTGPAPGDPFSGPTPEETIGAAFRQNNPIVSVVHAINQSRPDQTPVPGYDPIPMLVGTKYEGLLGQSLGDVNPAQTRARMAEMDQEDKDRQALAGSGWAGTVASFGAGMLDPSWLIPIGGEISAAGKGLSIGARLARGAAEGALRSGVSEAALMGSQVSRTPQEAMGDIASNTLLMGLLGGAHGFLSAPERKAATDGLDAIRHDFAPPAEPVPAPAPDTVRVYHAGQEPSPGESRWVSSRPENYSEGGKKPVWYADIPIDKLPSSARESYETNGFVTNFEHDPKVTGAEWEPYQSATPPTSGFAAPQPVGAAASERRTMELSPILPEQVRGAVGAIPGGEKALNWMTQIGYASSPSGRTFLNGSLPGKLAMGDLAETALKFTQAAKGIVASSVGTVPIDRLVKMDRIKFTRATRAAVENSYVKYLGVQGQQFAKQKAIYQGMMGVPDKLNLADFKRQVYLASTMGDQHAIPEVAQAASEIRRNVYEPVAKLAQSIKGPDGKPMLGEELSAPAGDQSFAPRIWNRDAVNANPQEFTRKVEAWLTQEQDRKADIKAKLNDLRERHNDLPEEAEDQKALLRSKMEDEIQRWGGKTTDEATAALKKREKAEAGREEGAKPLKAADKAVDDAVDRIINKSVTDRSPQELHALANEIKHRIDVSPDGRLPYDAPSGGPQMDHPSAQNQTRGSLNARDFAIPTKDVLDFIHTDPEHTIPAYLRTILPDLRLTERFGDVDMTEQFKKINEDYDQRIDQAKTAKAVDALQKQRVAEVRDLAATRDRIRGVYGLPTTTVQRNMGRVARAVGNWNVGAFLGTSVINRFQDMANATARRGLMGYMRDGLIPYVQGLSRIDAGSAAQRQAMKDLGVGVDTTMGHIASQFWDVAEDHLPGNRVERGLRSGASLAMIVTGHGPWTDMNKQIAGMAASADLLRTAGRIAKGTASERDIRVMAHAGIDPNLATRISQAFEDGGHTVVGDHKIPNSGEWKDRSAATAFEAAIQKDADIAVITPGAEKPLFLSDPVMGLLGQFKGFTMAAQERILLSNLQEADGRTLQGFFHMLAMGMLSYKAYTLAAGQQASDRPQDWVKEAVTRAGMLGWMSDANQIQAKFFGGKTDLWGLAGADRPTSRTAALSAPEQLLGPTYSLFSGLANAATNASFHAWSAQDTHRVRQALFLQNLMFFRRLLDQAEDRFNEYIGVRPMNRDRAQWPGAPQL